MSTITPSPIYDNIEYLKEQILNEKYSKVYQNDFNGLWWFKTVGKGNKLRKISVSDAVLLALKHWCQFLKLPALPTVTDNSPLLRKEKGLGGLSDQRHMRGFNTY